MTWRKTGSEFDDECAHVDLTDAAYRTHMEAIGHVYTLELTDCRIPKRSLPRFASSDQLAVAIKQLLDVGFWGDRGSHYELFHHAEVIRQSIAAQQRQRETSKKTSAKYRQKKAENPTSETPEVTRHVTQSTDRQTDMQLGAAGSKTCPHGTDVRFWKCSTCDAQEASA